MEVKHKTYWDMQKNCIAYAQNHQAAWKDIAVISNLVNSLVANEKELNNAVISQDSLKTNGHTEQKNQALEAHTAKMYKLCRKLTLYAKETGNAVLRAKADVPESKLDYLSDTDALTLFTSILLLARDGQTNLVNYGITTQELDALEAEQERLKKLIAQRNTVGEGRKQATRSIKECIADSRKILSKLDDAFEGMIDDNSIIAGWFDVRKIKGRRQGGDDTDNSNGTSTEDKTK